MLFFIIIFAVILIIIALLFFTDLTINLKFRRSPGYIHAGVEILMFKKIVIYKRKLSTSDKEKKEETSSITEKIDKFTEVFVRTLEMVKNYNEFIRKVNLRLGKGLKASKVNLETSIGTGDAASTGILCGAAWAILGTLKMQRDYYKVFGDIDFFVNPDYKKKIFTINFDSIFAIKTVYIIYVYILLKRMFEYEEKNIQKPNIKVETR